MGAVVAAVSRSATHGFSKPAESSIRLIAGLGVEGDAHFGSTVKHRSRVARDPRQPNLRQVHLIHAELFDELKETYPDLVLYRNAVSQTYTKWDYIVQYRETDFNFISRIMEQEGIFYFLNRSVRRKHQLRKRLLGLFHLIGTRVRRRPFQPIAFDQVFIG